MYSYRLLCANKQQSLKYHNQHLHEKEPQLDADNNNNKKKQNSLDVDTFSYLNISFGGYLRPLFLWHGPPISRVYSHYALSTMYFTEKISQVTFSSKSLQPIKSDCFDKKKKISRCAPNHFPAPSGLRTHSFVYS